MRPTDKCNLEFQSGCEHLNSRHQIAMTDGGMHFSCTQCTCNYDVTRHEVPYKPTNGFKMTETNTSVTAEPLKKQGDRSNKKPPYNMIPIEPLKRLALTYAEGLKYDTKPNPQSPCGGCYKNWMIGLPYSEIVDHLMEHVLHWVECQENGIRPNEDDLAHAAWGLFTLMWHEAHRQDMNDIWSRNPNNSYAKEFGDLWKQETSSDNSSKPSQT